MYKCKYFKIQELVCPHVYKKYGENSWIFFRKELLQELDMIRELLGVPLTINNWNINGPRSESGIRCTQCSIQSDKIKKGELSMSMHNSCNAFDIKLKGLDVKKAITIIMDNSHRFKSIKRIEDPKFTPTWIHIDTKGHHEGIILFEP